MLCDVDYFRIFEPDILNVDWQVMNDAFKNVNALDGWDVQSFDEKSEFFKKMFFFITFYNKRALLGRNVFINDEDVNGDGA